MRSCVVLFLLCSSALSSVALSSVASASTVAIQGASTTLANCIPFGANHSAPTPTTSYYAGFVYQNIPAFSLQPGDTIAFDLGAQNDNTIVVDIALAEAVSNGSDEPSSAGFTNVATSATPADPDGNSTAGDFELVFTAETAFSFSGGGLIIRVKPVGSFLSDTTCDQVLMWSDPTDSSGYFVKRIYGDADGAYPWDNGSLDTVANVIISTATGTTWYADTDGDGYGDLANTVSSATAPTGYVSDATDCDDGDGDTYPGAAAIDSSTACMTDADGDGYGDDSPASAVTAGTDCDDGDGDTFPGAAASDSSTACMTDADGDGYGDDSPASAVTAGTDCDDGSSSISPAATEVCDTIDNDCDGSIDEDSATDVLTWYLDSDIDGFGDGAVSDIDCDQPTGYVADNTDCNDSDGNTFPGAATDDSVTDCMTDADGDGFGDDSPATGITAGTDCDDSAEEVNPDETEVCDTLDNDCDGTIDEADASDVATWYADSDGDGYGDATLSDVSCSPPSSYVADATDCDDGDGNTFPGAAPNDSTILCMTDSDGDDYGDGSASGVVFAGTDCDDTNIAVSPAATELCDSVDNDCDGSIDEDTSADAQTWYIDADGDTYGADTYTEVSCSQPSGYVENDDDCDDLSATTYPGVAAEDSTTDCMSDSDGDGYGDDSPGSGLVTAGTDCDDGEAAINLAADELCDALDNNCDGTVDEDTAIDVATWYADLDGDSYGDASSTDIDCEQPDGYVDDATDCDDGDPDTYPGAPEEPYDGVDQDCDSADLCDVDGDGYDALEGDCGGDDCDDGDDDVHVDAEEIWYDGVDQNCDAWSDYDQDQDGQDWDAFDGEDCDDEDDTVYAGAPELPDGLDNDCNGLAEDDDTDGDGLADEEELALGTDPDRSDTDEDGLLDGEEVTDPAAPEDTDEDGLIDALDDDDDGDGIPTADEVGDHDGTDPSSEPRDTDGDGTPDHLDEDSDDDGRLDAEEGTEDDDCDGLLNWVDADDADGECPDDGITDSADPVDSGDVDDLDGGSPSKGDDACGGSESLLVPFGLGLLGLIGRRRRRTQA